jgi:formylmethanofuran dehydrogenase subunit A
LTGFPFGGPSFGLSPELRPAEVLLPERLKGVLAPSATRQARSLPLLSSAQYFIISKNQYVITYYRTMDQSNCNIFFSFLLTKNIKNPLTFVFKCRKTNIS